MRVKLGVFQVLVCEVNVHDMQYCKSVSLRECSKKRDTLNVARQGNNMADPWTKWGLGYRLFMW